MCNRVTVLARSLVLLTLLVVVGRRTVLAQSCVGDCNADNSVSITELGNGIKIALEQETTDACDVFDNDFDGAVTVDELVFAVRNAHNACAGSPWEFQSPAPVGDDLNGVSFVDAQNGWVVGSFGNILNTTDAGVTWDLTFIDSQVDLFGVKFLNTQLGWIVGDVGTILRTTDGGATWLDQDSGTDSSLSAVVFVDANIGWVVGDAATILHTTDGGGTWTSQNSPRNALLNAIYFSDAQNGWIAGNQGTILHTTNGGASWAVQSSTTGRSLYGIYFTDLNHGYVVGDEGVVLRTVDGGAHWTLTQPTGLADIPVGTTALWAITFVDSLNGWIVGDVDNDDSGSGDGIILHTTNGGDTWVREATDNTNALYGVAFVGATQGYAVGTSGTLLRTLNGASWSLQNPGPTNTLFGVTFTATATNGYAVGEFGAIGRTTDGGQTWLSSDSGTLEGLYAVTSVQIDSDPAFGDWGWAAGSNGTVLFTRSGGAQWEEQVTPTAETLFGIKFTDAATGWAVGDVGTIIHTVNGGLNWSAQTSNSPDCDGLPCALNAVTFIEPPTGTAQTGFVVGEAGTILSTTNGGATWTPQTSGTDESLFSVSCSDTQNCWAVGGTVDDTSPTQVILHTMNGGQTWSSQAAPADALAPLFGISAADAQNAWAVGDIFCASTTDCYGVIIATKDGGSSWELQDGGTSLFLNGVVFTDAHTGWVVGDGGLVIHTRSGGR